MSTVQKTHRHQYRTGPSQADFVSPLENVKTSGARKVSVGRRKRKERVGKKEKSYKPYWSRLPVLHPGHGSHTSGKKCTHYLGFPLFREQQNETKQKQKSKQLSRNPRFSHGRKILGSLTSCLLGELSVLCLALTVSSALRKGTGV